MNVVLVTPPLRELTGAPIRSYPLLVEDLGLGCMAAYLRSRGHEVRVLDCQMQQLGVSAATEQIESWQPDVLGVSISFQNTELWSGIELINSLRRAEFQQPIIAGGVTASFLHQFLLQKCSGLDMVCLGEGEQTMLDLVERLARGEEWRDMAGIAFHNGRQVVRTAPRPSIADLDQLPFAARDWLSAQLALYAAQGRNAEATMESSRGCPYWCTYCSVPAFHRHNGRGRLWRARSVAGVLDEMEALEKGWGVKVVQFVDDNFIGPGRKGQSRALSFAREHLRRKLQVSYMLWCRADSINEETFRPLKDAGLCGVSMGIETGSQAVLDRYQKKAGLSDNRRALETLTRLDIPVTVSLILFDPYTTLEELSDTIGFCLETGAHRMLERPTAINVLTPFPGTPIRDDIVADCDLTPLAADAELADSTLFWQYKCLNPEVDTVRGAFFKISAQVQKRVDDWLRLQDAISATSARLRRLLAASPDNGGGIGQTLAAFDLEQARRWQSWQHNIYDFLWMSYAAVVERAQEDRDALRSSAAPAFDWNRQFQTALIDYDRRYLGATFEEARRDTLRSITRSFAQTL